MHFHLDDQYQQRASIVHQLDARTKIVVALLFVLTTSLARNGAFVAYSILLLLVWAATFMARISLSYVLKRALVALPFALAAISLPFTIQGETIATLPMLGGLAISLEGTVRLASILFKSWISVQAAILLVAVTRFPDLMWGLQALKVPQPLVAIVSFMYRYLFVLSDEALRLLRARAARSATLPGLRSGGNLPWRGRVAGRMAGSLMLRSLERSERIYNAMVARGYRGRFRTFAHDSLSAREYLFITGVAVVMVAVLVTSYWII